MNFFQFYACIQKQFIQHLYAALFNDQKKAQINYFLNTKMIEQLKIVISFPMHIPKHAGRQIRNIPS